MVLARRASYAKKTLAQRVIPLVPGYRTALLSRPDIFSCVFIIPCIPTTDTLVSRLHLVQIFVGVFYAREENLRMHAKLPVIRGSLATFKSSLLVHFGLYIKRLLCKFEEIKEFSEWFVNSHDCVLLKITNFINQ